MERDNQERTDDLLATRRIMSIHWDESAQESQRTVCLAKSRGLSNETAEPSCILSFCHTFTIKKLECLESPFDMSPLFFQHSQSEERVEPSAPIGPAP
jgi:hypothetical protein